jgi:pimeloyl-ACP methyl ester carboxylesterase
MPKTKKQRNKIIVIILAILFLLAPLSFDVDKKGIKKTKAESEVPIIFPHNDPDRIIEITDRQHQWKKDDNIVIRKVIVVREGASLTIEKGSMIKFEKEEGELAPFIFVEDGGLLVAQGEEDEKIVLTSDQENSNFSIVFEGSNDGRGYSGYLRYVEISKAGGVHEIETGPPYQSLFPSFVLQALADDEQIIEEDRFPIKHLGGVLQIENCRFYNNKNPDLHISEKEIDPENLRSNYKESLVSVTNSNFENNETGVAVRADHKCVSESNVADCKKILYLKNNWYGKNTGPNPIPYSWQYYQDHQFDGQFDGFFGAKVIGELIKINGFRKKDLIADPVIIIPGIMGSSKKTKSALNNNLVLDPILHRYEDLIKSLKRNGYEKDINLFEFPYDWRNSNVMTAQELAEKITEIQAETSLDFVDIIAHSMGGLVARQYIQNGSDYDFYYIDQLITLGTPHKGSPQAYLQWEAGEGFLSFEDILAKWHFTREAKHDGYNDIFSYIKNRVLSVKELLPDYDYLYDVDTEEMRNYPDDYPRNIFLENLNNNTGNLNYIRTFNIAGNVGDETIEEIKIEKYEGDDIWEHGMPENFNDNPGQGLELGEGDETVPLYSATGFNAQKTVTIDATHGELPTKSQCLIFKDLTGMENCDYDEDINIPKFLLFNLYSPVDMQVVAPDGKRIGKDFETGEFFNEIDLAYYSGFDGEDEFITIPNPIKGEYKIKTQATDSGDYKVEVVNMEEDSETGEIKETIKSFDGVAESVGEEKEVSVNINEDGNIQTDETPPVISISSPEENKEYLNNEILNTDYEVSDDVSEQEDIVESKFFDNKVLEENRIDLSLQFLGEHQFKVEATDEAGNMSQEEINFSVSTDINALTDNINHYYELGLIKNQKIKKYLNIKLRSIERLIKFKQRMENHPRMHKKFKKRITRNIDRIIKRHINRTVWQVKKNRKIKRNINEKTRELIIEQLKYIKKSV